MQALEVAGVARALGHPALSGFSLDGPRPGDLIFEDAVEVDGWVVGALAPVRAVLVLDSDGLLLCRVPVDRERLDVFDALPDREWSASSGYRGWVPLASIGGGGSLSVTAETKDGMHIPLATIEMRPAPVPATDEDPKRQPDFIIIGAQRSGSTSLYSYLTQHPHVIPARTKEVKYFSSFYDRPWTWYLQQFPGNRPQGTVSGEATPYYLAHPLAPKRIATHLPDVRLVAILRNPVDRAYSHWAHEVARGTEWLTFEEALAAEPIRLAGERERMQANEKYQSVSYQVHSYVTRGKYADHLAVWLRHVSRERLLVLRSDDLYTDPKTTVRRVTDFLGIVPASLTDDRVHNRRAYQPLSPFLRAKLEELFADSNRDLEDLLGQQFGWVRS